MSDKLSELVDDLALAENFNEHDTARSALRAAISQLEQERDSAERRVSNWIKRFSIEENKRIEFEHGRIPELEAQLKDAEQLGNGLADALRLRANARRQPTTDKLVKLWDEYRARLAKKGG
jgi:hypothetical protein